MKIYSIFENFNLRLKKSPVIYRLVHGATWSLMGAGASRFLSMITNIFIARILGRENFGMFGMVDSTIGMFGLFAGFAMGSTMTKYIAELKVKDPERAGRILTLTKTMSIFLGGIILVIVFLISPWLARVTLKRPEMSPLLQIGALLLFANTVNNVLCGSLAGFEAFKKIAQINLLQGVITPFLVVPLTYYYGVQGTILGFIFVSVMSYWIFNLALRQECHKYAISNRTFARYSFKEWRVLWDFSLPATVSGMLVIPVAWISNTLLVNQPNGYGELGLFNVANQWRQMIIFIPQILMSVMLPIFAEIYGRQNQEDFSDALKFNLRLTWTIALPMTILVIAIRSPLAALFGNQFEGAGPLIMLLMVTAFLNIINNVVGTALAGAGRMWLGAAFNLGWAVVLITSTVILAPLYGGFGMALAYLIAYSMHTFWQMLYVDLKLAPSAVLNQWKLVAVSIVTIIPVCLVEYFRISSLMNLFLIILAFLPLCKLGFETFAKSELHY